MKASRWIISGQADTEVQHLMDSKNCSSCFGCPNATLLASEVISMSMYDHSIVTAVSELEVLTRDCQGYSDNKPATHPSEMCQSPLANSPKVSIFAGKILDFARLRF